MTANEHSPPVAAPRRGVSSRLIIALLLIAFVAGAAASVWLSNNWQRLRSGGGEASTENTADAAANMTGVYDPAANYAEAPDAVPPGALGEQVARVAALEQRLARIALAAQAASYNANRAEAIMTAFAARRALDAGRPLGYVEAALRARFGDAQPKAVATIVNAAAEPVTLADLRIGLDDISLRSEQREEGWWSSFLRELRGAAVIRHAKAPSPAPELRLMRARRAVETGQVDVAVEEMEAIEQQPAITDWLQLARRWNEAHRALDVIEAAAILEPRTATALESQAESATGKALAPPGAEVGPAPAGAVSSSAPPPR